MTETNTDYYITYEYKQIHEELIKLNEKMDKILTIVEKKPRKNTLSEVNSKMDSLLDQFEETKKRKLDDTTSVI
jgi:hypothetical protein